MSCKRLSILSCGVLWCWQLVYSICICLNNVMLYTNQQLLLQNGGMAATEPQHPPPSCSSCGCRFRHSRELRLPERARTTTWFPGLFNAV
jgi:hypothetical protein